MSRGKLAQGLFENVIYGVYRIGVRLFEGLKNFFRSGLLFAFHRCVLYYCREIVGRIFYMFNFSESRHSGLLFHPSSDSIFPVAPVAQPG